MAETTVGLSDAQIDELLSQAEVRLLEKQQALQSTSVSAAQQSSETASKPKDSASITHTIHASTPSTSALGSQKGEELSVRVPIARKSKKEMTHKANAGPQWFNLPATDLTPELRRDLQLLRMRDVLDPKRHYKKDTTQAIPEFSQVGTVIPGPTDYFNARLTRKERNRTLLGDVLATEAETRRFKNKYGEIQAVKTSGKKAYYKKAMQKRYGRNYKG